MTELPREPTLTLLVDDTRDFRDGRPALAARTSADALALLDSIAGSPGPPIGDLWLDYNLVGEDTVQPVVDRLVALADAGTPLAVGRIHVHSSNIRHGHRICAQLAAAGYPARRSYAAGMWVRARWPGPLP